MLRASDLTGSATLGWRASLALVLAALGATAWIAASPAADPLVSITAAELGTHVRFLASDDLEGRDVGGPGNDRASRYVADTLARGGLTPEATATGFLQPFSIASTTLGPDNAIALADATSTNGPELHRGVGEDFYPLPLSADATAEGPLVFAGYGISAPELGYDDYENLDVSGAIVAVLRHEPQEEESSSRFDGDQLSIHATFQRKVEVARARGAVGLVVIPDGRHRATRRRLPDLERTWPPRRTARARRFELVESEVGDGLPAALISVDLAELLLERADRTGPTSVAGLRDSIDTVLADLGDSARVAAPASFRIGQYRMRLSVDLERERLEPANVIGVLEGSDPAFRHERIVIGAHLDHTGVDERDRIYNGADDNASGTAALLEVAEAMTLASRTGAGPRRSIVFAAWNAEEKGSLGSRHFLRNTSPGSPKIVAMLNLDMVGRSEEVPDPTQSRFRGLRKSTASDNRLVLHLVGYSYSPDLAQVVAKANDDIGLTLRSEYDNHAQDLLHRSDQWPFLERGIPALFFTTGLHPDYHTPEDDPDKIDYAKLERVSRLVFRTALQLSRQEAVPRFVSPSTSAKP